MTLLIICLSILFIVFIVLMVKYINISKCVALKTQEIEGLKSDLQEKETELHEKQTVINDKETEFKAKEMELKSREIENIKIKEQKNSLDEKFKMLDEQKNNLEKAAEELQKKSAMQFENLANKIFEDKSQKFSDSNKKNIDIILNPLKEDINNFKKKVEDTYDKGAQQRASLETWVKNLIEQTGKVSTEANNLARALKGDSKIQGDWGEMLLETLLQQSGLIKSIHYFTQMSVKNEDGNNIRPDVMVKLPDDRMIVIDSKVSLTAYDAMMSADNHEIRNQKLKDHIASIKKHIDELSPKNYDEIEGSLDFIMMFVPIEPAYLVAMQEKPELWTYAYSKRILLISPTNLIACLKIVEDLWKKDDIGKNAMAIAKKGASLYDKFVGFLESMDELGKNIDKASNSYITAKKRLIDGNGNLIKQAEDLKDLGLKVNKTIPQNFKE
ncbi:MAG: DNA recombination protein RmuC [Bacteroidales bacterium]